MLGKRSKARSAVVLDERGRRRFAASEALAAGRGGIAAVSEATGIAAARSAGAWMSCAAKRRIVAKGGIRRAGAGRKALTEVAREICTAGISGISA